MVLRHAGQYRQSQAIASGYLVGATLMLVAALTEWKLGVSAERRSLEEIAKPLSSIEE